VDGQIAQQSSSYRQGLVLGLTMAELMLLLVFCLLIALAAYLRFEKTQLVAANAAPNSEGVSQADRSVLNAVRQNRPLYEKFRDAGATANRKPIDDFWRDLVADQQVASELRKLGLSLEQARHKIQEAEALEAKGVTAATALRDVDIVGSIESRLSKNGDQTDPQTILQTIQKALDGKNAAGHQWPPIIELSEADGHYFKTGSAELSPDFRTTLMTKVPELIADRMQQYNVDVIEVVGHTDEQPIAGRLSNLDQGLVPVLRNGKEIGSLVPADNAGLGLARAVSVVSVLRESKLLQGYKLIPLSAAQLVNTDETLDLTGTAGDIRERRRIEIRLRKTSVHDAPIFEVQKDFPEIPIPRPRPASPAKPKPRSGPEPFPAAVPLR
jgi:flagellar motor protein MotB